MSAQTPSCVFCREVHLGDCTPIVPRAVAVDVVVFAPLTIEEIRAALNRFDGYRTVFPTAEITREERALRHLAMLLEGGAR